VKNLPSPLLTFLQTTTTYGRADLFQITLTNGQILRTTSGQVDMVYAGNTYYSSLYGSWERGSIKSEASFKLQAEDMALTARVGASVNFPGTTIPFMNVLYAGPFDGAAVMVYTAYWAVNEKPNAARGVEVKFVGQILNFNRAGRSVVEFVVGDLLYLLNLKTPPNVIQAGCRHVLYGPNCGASQASFTVSNSVAAGSTTNTINLTTAVAASVYAQGFITFTSGQNKGLSMAIKSQPSTTQITLAGKTPLTLTLGDTFTMSQGCNKTQARCAVIHGPTFYLNYGGQDYVPSPEMAV
jgi:hypothetical protein